MKKYLPLRVRQVLLALFYPLLFAAPAPVSAQGFWTGFQGPEGLSIDRFYYNTLGQCYALDYKGRFYRSLDNGQTWALQPVPNAIKPTLKYNLNVGYDGTLFCIEPPVNIWHSKDYGTTWSLLDHPFLAPSGCTTLPGGTILCNSYDKVYFSPDGLFWYKRLDLEGTFSDTNFGKMSWRPDSTVVMQVETGFLSGSFVLRSDNEGITWDTLPGGYDTELPIPISGGRMIIYGGFSGLWGITHPDFDQVQQITLPPDSYGAALMVHGDTLYIGEYKSTDLGTTWETYGGSTSDLKHDFPLKDNKWIRSNYFATTQGSQDQGRSWCYSSKGADNGWLFDWTFHGDKVWCHSDLGLWYSDNNGQDWALTEAECVDANTENSVYNLAVNASGTLFLARADGTFRSDDGGLTRVDITPDIVPNRIGRVTVHPTTGAIYATADSFLLVANPMGEDWQIRAQGIRFFPHPIVVHPSGALYAIRNVPNQGNKLIRSDDDGANWQFVEHSPPYNLADVIAIHPNGTIVVSYYNKIYRSADGVSWEPRDVPISVDGLAFAADGTLFIHSIFEAPIYKSKDLGNIWQPLPALPGVPNGEGVMSIAVSPDQQLWVCTDNYGRFKSDLTSSDKPAISPKASITLAPNPAFSGVWVYGAQEAAAQIEIVDLYGRVLLQTTEVALPYFIPLSNYTPGQYWVKATQAEGVSVVPLLVHRF